MFAKVQLELPDSIRGILFDCDGTILDSEPMHAVNLSQVLKNFGLNFSAEELSARFRGQHDIHVYEALFNENSKISRDEFLQTKTNGLLQQLQRTSLEQIKPLLTPGFLESFNYLKSKNYILAVVSASEEVFLECLLNKLGIRKDINLLVHGSSTLLPKPSPAPYLKALRELELHPDEVVIFEDSEAGLESALGTGAETVWVNCHHPDTESSISDGLATCDNFYWLMKK